MLFVFIIAFTVLFCIVILFQAPAIGENKTISGVKSPSGPLSNYTKD